jgi:hypothetical protein
VTSAQKLSASETGSHDLVGAFARLEHGCDVVVVVKARGQHVVEAVRGD